MFSSFHNLHLFFKRFRTFLYRQYPFEICILMEHIKKWSKAPWNHHCPCKFDRWLRTSASSRPPHGHLEPWNHHWQQPWKVTIPGWWLYHMLFGYTMNNMIFGGIPYVGGYTTSMAMHMLFGYTMHIRNTRRVMILLAGGWAYPSEKYTKYEKVTWDDEIFMYLENESDCSKPPTRKQMIHHDSPVVHTGYTLW